MNVVAAGSATAEQTVTAVSLVFVLIATGMLALIIVWADQADAQAEREQEARWREWYTGLDEGMASRRPASEETEQPS